MNTTRCCIPFVLSPGNRCSCHHRISPALLVSFPTLILIFVAQISSHLRRFTFRKHCSPKKRSCRCAATHHPVIEDPAARVQLAMRLGLESTALGFSAPLWLSLACAAATPPVSSCCLERGDGLSHSYATNGADADKPAHFSAVDAGEERHRAPSGAVWPVAARAAAVSARRHQRRQAPLLQRRDETAVPHAENEERRAAELLYTRMSAEERKWVNIRNAQDISKLYEVPIEVARCYVVCFS